MALIFQMTIIEHENEFCTKKTQIENVHQDVGFPMKWLNYVYIGIGIKCMYKGHFNGPAFVKARVAQSVEHHATNFKVIGSSTTFGKNVLLSILSLLTLSWQVPWSLTI